MSKMQFCYFMDYEDGKMARMETAENEIPVNIFIDNAADYADAGEGPCEIQICGVGSDIEIYATEEEFEAAHPRLADISMIPAGTFSVNSDDENFEESPHILFSGRVLDVERNPEAEADGPNCFILVETLEMEVSLYLRCDGPVEPGYIVYGVAWLFGDLQMEGPENAED